MPFVKKSDFRMTREKIDRIIAMYESALARPTMYFGREDDCDAMVHFRGGLIAGLSIAEQLHDSFLQPYGFQTKYFMKRHWNEGLFTPMKAMTREGLPREQIVQELIKLEIEMWREYGLGLDTEA
jgi:hypothetical protein